MTDRQRAAIAAVVYTIKNKKYFSWHRIGVKRIDGLTMYDINGELTRHKINLKDDKYYYIRDQQILDDGYHLKIDYQWTKGTDVLELKLKKGSSSFEGYDGDYFRFEGRYFDNSDEVEIRDYSQDKDKYVYRITW